MGARERPSLRRWSMFAFTWHFAVWVGWGLVLLALLSLTPLEVAERSAGNLLPVPWIEAEDVAEAVVYLVSDRARFVTGSTFVIDAGLLTR